MKTTKKLVIGLLVAAGLVSAVGFISSKPQTTQAVSTLQEKAPIIKFDTLEAHFGEITQGDVFEYDFIFKNTGSAPLVITNAKGSCGCTVPVWPREPIAPGQKGKIAVKFNSAGKMGTQNKTVTLSTNASPKPVTLFVKGVVKAK